VIIIRRAADSEPISIITLSAPDSNILSRQPIRNPLASPTVHGTDLAKVQIHEGTRGNSVEKVTEPIPLAAATKLVLKSERPVLIVVLPRGSISNEIDLGRPLPTVLPFLSGEIFQFQFSVPSKSRLLVWRDSFYGAPDTNTCKTSKTNRLLLLIENVYSGCFINKAKRRRGPFCRRILMSAKRTCKEGNYKSYPFQTFAESHMENIRLHFRFQKIWLGLGSAV
jgi:hypothetical protein